MTILSITEIAPLTLVHDETFETMKITNVDTQNEQTDFNKSKIVPNQRDNKTKIYSNKYSFQNSNLLINIFVFMLMIIPILGAKVHITKFEVHPGIYFDGLADVQLVNHKWNLITYYNMTDYWKAAFQFQQLPEKLEKMCSHPICLQTLRQLHTNLADLNVMNNLIT